MQHLLVKKNTDLSLIIKPKNKIRKFIYEFLKSNKFETIIMICIFLNIITMAMAYDTSSATYNNVNYFYYNFHNHSLKLICKLQKIKIKNQVFEYL